MKDVPNTETNTANEQLVAPQSVEPAQHPVPAVKPRVVIVGAGFGGLHAARALRDAPVQVTEEILEKDLERVGEARERHSNESKSALGGGNWRHRFMVYNRPAAYCNRQFDERRIQTRSLHCTRAAAGHQSF